MALLGAQFVNAVSPNPVGSLQAYAGASAPTGWLLCDGTSYSTSVYPELYSVLGYTYGGSGANFNVPDLRGRVPMGAGTGTGLNASGTGAPSGTAQTARTRGQWGGEETHLLTGAESGTSAHNHGITDPGHSHTFGVYGGSFPGGAAAASSFTGHGLYEIRATSGVGTGITVNNSAAANAASRHNVVPPFVVTNYIIKAVSDAPRSGLAYGSTPPIVTELPSNPQFGEEVVHRQTVAGTTYSTLKQWDGTAWVATGPQPATTWVSPTLNSPWTNYGGGWQPARYTRDAMGTVFVEGLVTGGSLGVVFTLPAGFRPAQTLIFSTVANNTFARLDIGGNGDVVWNIGGTSAFVSISCNFKASQ